MNEAASGMDFRCLTDESISRISLLAKHIAGLVFGPRDEWQHGFLPTWNYGARERTSLQNDRSGGEGGRAAFVYAPAMGAV